MAGQDDHRAGSRLDHPASHPAEQDAAQRPVASRAEQEQIEVGGDGDQLVGWIAVEQDRFGPDVAGDGSRGPLGASP